MRRRAKARDEARAACKEKFACESEWEAKKKRVTMMMIAFFYFLLYFITRSGGSIFSNPTGFEVSTLLTFSSFFFCEKKDMLKKNQILHAAQQKYVHLYRNVLYTFFRALQGVPTRHLGSHPSSARAACVYACTHTHNTCISTLTHKRQGTQNDPNK